MLKRKDRSGSSSISTVEPKKARALGNGGEMDGDEREEQLEDSEKLGRKRRDRSDCEIALVDLKRTRVVRNRGDAVLSQDSEEAGCSTRRSADCLEVTAHDQKLEHLTEDSAERDRCASEGVGSAEWGSTDEDDQTTIHGGDSEQECLPSYEGVLPVDPATKEYQRYCSQIPVEDPLQIQTQQGDDLRGTWMILSQLGEGTYGNVKLIENSHGNRHLAVKVIKHCTYDRVRDADLPDMIRREITIHKTLDHKNIIRYFGDRAFERETYIFLEYACGGELYERIEPDIGVPRSKCHKWFVELMDGLEYLHEKGVCHRDIKPENLLLSATDELKISDFGLATVFKMNGKHRKLNKKCGTTSYVAPEVYDKEEFHGPPLDIWSAGVVLVTMIGGEFPWEEASLSYETYVLWVMKSLDKSPWNKMPSECLGLFRMMLDPNPDTRATIPMIRKDSWFKRGFTQKAISAPPPKPIPYVADHVPSSVPIHRVDRPSDFVNSSLAPPNPRVQGDLSQPARLNDITYTQIRATQLTQKGQCRDPLRRLVNRLTRFYVVCGVKEAIDALSGILSAMRLEISRDSQGLYTISGPSQSRGNLVLKVSFLRVHHRILMDFRLSKGNGIEFKRVFAILRQKMHDLIDDCENIWTQQEPSQRPNETEG